MELLVVRHGVTEKKALSSAKDDNEVHLPLTKEGVWKMQRATRGLRHLVPSLDVIATSPLKRALQTAEVLASAYRGTKVERLDALNPEGRPQEFIAWLRERQLHERIAAIGHEPHLSSLVSWLITGEEIEGRFSLRKGGACLLEFDDRPWRGKAKLIWSLPSSTLRRVTE